MIDIRFSYPKNIQSHSINYYVCGKGGNDLWPGWDKPFREFQVDVSRVWQIAGIEKSLVLFHFAEQPTIEKERKEKKKQGMIPRRSHYPIFLC